MWNVIRMLDVLHATEMDLFGGGGGEEGFLFIIKGFCVPIPSEISRNNGNTIKQSHLMSDTSRDNGSKCGISSIPCLPTAFFPCILCSLRSREWFGMNRPITLYSLLLSRKREREKKSGNPLKMPIDAHAFAEAKKSYDVEMTRQMNKMPATSIRYGPDNERRPWRCIQHSR